MRVEVASFAPLDILSSAAATIAEGEVMHLLLRKKHRHHRKTNISR